jgi:DNA repair exonuclease SbcCD ATPase subunit
MATATISFDAFKQSKNGAIKEEIVPLISMDGEIGVPVKSLSGGERTAIDLAIDLAVIDMIESITGKGLDLFILDEPFNGLDHISIENCLEIIKNHDTNKRIIIVDHSSETKEMIGFRVVVERSGQESEIKIYER